MIAPISTDARKFFNDKPYLIFTTKEHFADQTNYFTRLQFHSGRCYGICRDLRLTLGKLSYDDRQFTLTLYQYDTTYYFHLANDAVPCVSRELTGFLNGLFRHPSLHRVDTTWTYEHEKDRGDWDPYDR